MSKKRPGVEAAIQLAKCQDPAVWNQVVGHRDEVLSKMENKNLPQLQANADQLGEELRNETKKACITKSELLEVVIPWKFAVGKPRHALLGQLASNTESDVTEATQQGIARAKELSSGDDTSNDSAIQDAVNSIAKLRGVGPATASVILSLVRPEIFGYMYDEVIDCFLPKRTYTIKAYLAMNDECTKVARRLNKHNGAGGGRTNEFCWTPAKVATTLWVAARAKANGMEIVTTKGNSSMKSEKRQSVDDHASGRSNSASKRQRKRK